MSQCQAGVALRSPLSESDKLDYVMDNWETRSQLKLEQVWGVAGPLAHTSEILASKSTDFSKLEPASFLSACGVAARHKSCQRFVRSPVAKSVVCRVGLQQAFEHREGISRWRDSASMLVVPLPGHLFGVC